MDPATTQGGQFVKRKTKNSCVVYYQGSEVRELKPSSNGGRKQIPSHNVSEYLISKKHTVKVGIMKVRTMNL